MSSAPNFVIIMADQLSPAFMGTYGHGLVRTPAIDALAGRGVLFENAYTNSPLCAPARFAFMSGKLITALAAYDNASEFPGSIPTMAHYLRSMGYHTSLCGKMHFVGPDQLHGFNQRLTTDMYPVDFAWTPDWEMPDERIDAFYHNMSSVRDAGVAATTNQIDYDEEVGWSARRRIFDYARHPGQQPFFLVVSFTHPHDPYVALPEWWNLYDHEAVDAPAVPALPLSEQDNHSRRLMAGIDAANAPVTDGQVRNARHAYYANVSYFDHWVGRIVQTLNDAQFADNTVVIVTSDHGDMLGERGLWYKMCFFEPAVRIPLVVAGPSLPEAKRLASNVSLIDILPTLLDLAEAGGAGPQPVLGDAIDGRSLGPILSGDSTGDRDEAISEYAAECASHPCFMIKRGRFKYIHCDVDPPLMFDTEADPRERTNLIDDPQHRETICSFATEVARRWDSEQIRLDVIATQKRRRAIHLAMQRGERTAWDYSPFRDASNEYVRSHMDVTEADVLSRFPPLRRPAT